MSKLLDALRSEERAWRAVVDERGLRLKEAHERHDEAIRTHERYADEIRTQERLAAVPVSTGRTEDTPLDSTNGAAS